MSVFYLVLFRVLTSYTCGSYCLLSFPLWEVLGHTCGPSVALLSECWDMPVSISCVVFREDAQCCILLFVIQPLCPRSCHLLHSTGFYYRQKGAESFLLYREPFGFLSFSSAPAIAFSVFLLSCGTHSRSVLADERILCIRQSRWYKSCFSDKAVQQLGDCIQYFSGVWKHFYQLALKLVRVPKVKSSWL